MTTNDQVRDENYNMISTKKPPKYQLYHHAKLTSMNIKK